MVIGTETTSRERVSFGDVIFNEENLLYNTSEVLFAWLWWFFESYKFRCLQSISAVKSHCWTPKRREMSVTRVTFTITISFATLDFIFFITNLVMASFSLTVFHFHQLLWASWNISLKFPWCCFTGLTLAGNLVYCSVTLHRNSFSSHPSLPFALTDYRGAGSFWVGLRLSHSRTFLVFDWTQKKTSDPVLMGWHGGNCGQIVFVYERLPWL